jgi:hypothetical protein
MITFWSQPFGSLFILKRTKNPMKRLIVLLAALAVFATALPAMAGNAHFVGSPTITVDGNDVTASGKIAGLGNEGQVHVTVTGEAACVNPGTKKPKAANKQSFGAEGDFPIQNGKANFELTMTATFSPNCTPPMTVEWSNIQLDFST